MIVLDPEYLTKRIVLENVTHYAYGQHNDGEVGFWVAGRAGWFSISPAKGYKPMFNEVVEAIDLLYFLADRHKRKRGRRKFEGPSVEYLFEEVSVFPSALYTYKDRKVGRGLKQRNKTWHKDKTWLARACSGCMAIG